MISYLALYIAMPLKEDKSIINYILMFFFTKEACGNTSVEIEKCQQVFAFRIYINAATLFFFLSLSLLIPST